MKKILLLTMIGLLGLTAVTTEASAQEQELEELALDIEKLAQFRQILSGLEKSYEILSGGYNTIRNISEGNFSMHQAFLDGLLGISPVVAKYKKIGYVTAGQLQLVQQYKQAWKRFRSDENFSVTELDYIGKVYDRLVNESIKNMQALLNVVTAGRLRMSDDERLSAIDAIANDMQNKLSFLQYFNNNALVLSLQRTKAKNEVNSSRLLHAVQK